jgi:hypothetical protein
MLSACSQVPHGGLAAAGKGQPWTDGRLRSLCSCLAACTPGAAGSTRGPLYRSSTSTRQSMTSRKLWGTFLAALAAALWEAPMQAWK